MSAHAGSVLIVDDNSLIRSALRMFLEASMELNVCGEASDGLEAVEVARELDPDVVLMDVSMPNLNGIEAAWMIKRYLPEARIVVFTLYSDMTGWALAKTAGVDLIVAKADGATALVEGLQRLLAETSRQPS